MLLKCFFFFIVHRPPSSTLTGTLFPYTTRFRSGRGVAVSAARQLARGHHRHPRHHLFIPHDGDGDERVSRAGQSDEPWRIELWSDRRWRRDHHRELPGATGSSSGTRRTAADASGAARRNDACFAGDDQNDRVRPGDHPPLLRTASYVHGCRGRAEERRVGKGCVGTGRAWWWTEQLKKKK